MRTTHLHSTRQYKKTGKRISCLVIVALSVCLVIGGVILILREGTTLDQSLPLPLLISSSPTPAPLSQYVNPQGNFSLSYPTDWQGEDVGSSAYQWVLPEGVAVAILSEIVSSEDTLENMAQEVVTEIPYDVLNQTEAQVGGERAIRQEVAFPGSSKRIAVCYLVLHGGQKYQISLFDLDMLSEIQQSEVIAKFEKMVATFVFP